MLIRDNLLAFHCTYLYNLAHLYATASGCMQQIHVPVCESSVLAAVTMSVGNTLNLASSAATKAQTHSLEEEVVLPNSCNLQYSVARTRSCH